MNNQRVSGLRTFDVERTGERVIAFDERKTISGFLQRVAKTVQGVRVKDIARSQMCNRWRDAKDIFHIVDCRVIVHDFGFGGRRLSLSQSTDRQNQGESNYVDGYGNHRELGDEVQHNRVAESI